MPMPDAACTILGPLKLRLEAGGQSPVTSGQIWALGEVTARGTRDSKRPTDVGGGVLR